MSHHLMGTAEIAEHLNVSASRVRQLAERPDFPAPSVRLKTGNVWESAEIEAWAAAGWNRQPGRPRITDQGGRTPAIPDGVYTVAEAAELLGCSRSWLYKAVESKAPAEPIPHGREGRRLLFSRQDLEIIINGAVVPGRAGPTGPR